MAKKDEVLDRLKVGIRKFSTEVYPDKEDFYKVAAETPQRPHTLIICCADSRIDLETITQVEPGEIFVARNVGNMVPPYGGTLGGVSSVIEYAIDVLHVKHAVVCGHSDCGAMKGLLQPDSLEAIPTVKNWLRNGAAALRVAETIEHKKGMELLPSLTEHNVLLQMTHLRTHPSVAGQIAQGELTISGWVYDIARGQIRIYDEELKKFELLTGTSPTKMDGASR